MKIKKSLEDLVVLGVSTLILMSSSWFNKDDARLAILREDLNNQIALLEQSKGTKKSAQKSTTTIQTKDEVTLRLEDIEQANEKKDFVKFQRGMNMLYNHIVKNKIEISFDMYMKIIGYNSYFKEWAYDNPDFIEWNNANSKRKDWYREFYDLYQEQHGLITYTYMKDYTKGKSKSTPSDKKEKSTSTSYTKPYSKSDNSAGYEVKQQGKKSANWDTYKSIQEFENDPNIDPDILAQARRVEERLRELRTMIYDGIENFDEILEIDGKLNALGKGDLALVPYQSNEFNRIMQIYEQKQEEYRKRMSEPSSSIMRQERKQRLSEMVERHITYLANQRPQLFINDILDGTNLALKSDNPKNLYFLNLGSLYPSHIGISDVNELKEGEAEELGITEIGRISPNEAFIILTIGLKDVINDKNVGAWLIWEYFKYTGKEWKVNRVYAQQYKIFDDKPVLENSYEY